MTFGSATLFEPLENTCYGSTSLTVVDRTQGTVGQRKRATFDSNGIVLSNPLATSIDDPGIITLNRAKLALIQRIAAIDVQGGDDTEVTSTKRMLIGDKISGAYSYAIAPTVPAYIGTNGISLGNTTVSPNSVEVVNPSGPGVASMSVSGIKYFGASIDSSIDGNGSLISSKDGKSHIYTSPTSFSFRKDGEVDMTLDHADVKNLRANFLEAASAAAITDVDASGSIRFLTSPSSGGAKKFLAVPGSYSWLRSGSIVGTLVNGAITNTTSFLPASVSVALNNTNVPTSSSTATLESERLIMSSYFFTSAYSAAGISMDISGTVDPTFGGGTAVLRYRGAGAATALGRDASVVSSSLNVDHIVTAKDTGVGGVRYNYLRVADVIPSINGSVIELKRNAAAVLNPGLGAAVPAVLDAAGLSFPVNALPLATGATNAPHDGTTYNSAFMRIGTTAPQNEYLKATNTSIELVDDDYVSRVLIDKNKMTVGFPYAQTTIFAGYINFTSDSVSTEFPGNANFGEAPSCMVNSMYLNMNTITAPKKSIMVIDNTSGTKVFNYPQYISPGNHHRFPLGSPNGVAASGTAINAFTTGNTGSGIYTVSGGLRANFGTFGGAMKVIPFGTSSRLFLNFDFTDATNYFASGSLATSLQSQIPSSSSNIIATLLKRQGPKVVFSP